MSPYLPDDERAGRLAALRLGEIELTESEQKTLEVIRQLQADGQQVTNKSVYRLVGGNFGQLCSRMKKLRQMGLLVSVSDDDGADTN